MSSTICILLRNNVSFLYSYFLIHPYLSPSKQLAEKELQKINAFKAPREKLLCILNCCRVINNLLLNASMSENRVPGADDFLPVLIYVTIKASSHW